MIGIYIANFVVDVKDKSGAIIDDIKTKGKEAAASFSTEETTTEEATSTEPEPPKKSGRERLKDKGLL